MAFKYEQGFSAAGGPIPRGSSPLSTPAPTTPSAQARAKALFQASGSQQGRKAAYGATTAKMDEQPGNRRQRLHRALSSNQFSRHPVMQKFGQGLDLYETSRAFRHSGLLPAMRYAVGAPQTSYHLKDLLGGQALRHGANTGNSPHSEYPGTAYPVDFTAGEA